MEHWKTVSLGDIVLYTLIQLSHSVGDASAEARTLLKLVIYRLRQCHGIRLQHSFSLAHQRSAKSPSSSTLVGIGGVVVDEPMEEATSGGGGGGDGGGGGGDEDTKMSAEDTVVGEELADESSPMAELDHQHRHSSKRSTQAFDMLRPLHRGIVPILTEMKN